MSHDPSAGPLTVASLGLSDETRAKAAHLLDLLPTSLPRPTGYNVLVMQYRKPEKVGSIIIAGVTHKEDEYQGRVGLVLAIGAGAYLPPDRYPGGAWCKPGDWIMWPAVEQANSRFKLGTKRDDAPLLAIVRDDAVLATAVDPETVL